MARKIQELLPFNLVAPGCEAPYRGRGIKGKGLVNNLVVYG